MLGGENCLFFPQGGGGGGGNRLPNKKNMSNLLGYAHGEDTTGGIEPGRM